MKPFHLLVRIFVDTFGITQPTPENEAKAGRFILLMLIGVAVFLVGAVWVIRSTFLR